MTARRRSAAKSKSSGSSRRPRLNQESIAAERARSQRGSSRKGMFYRAPSKNGKAIPFQQEMRFLPAFGYRGPEEKDNEAVRPYFLIGQHWCEKKNDDGETFMAGITCTDFMRDEQPRAWERYKKEKVEAAIEDERCIFCEVLEDLAEEDEDGDREWHESLPTGRFGSDPAWMRRYAHNFAVLLPQDAYEEDDEQMVKLYAAPRSVKDGLYKYLDKKTYADLFEEEGGWWVEVERFQKGRGPWDYNVTPTEQEDTLWYENWEEDLLDLEMVSPNWMTRKETVEWMLEEYPEVLEAFSGPVSRTTRGSNGSGRKRAASTNSKGSTRKGTTGSRKTQSASRSKQPRSSSRASAKKQSAAKPKRKVARRKMAKS